LIEKIVDFTGAESKVKVEDRRIRPEKSEVMRLL
jgi:hypothetical protein